jgi:S-adenosylmethionine decarboxylase
MFARGCEWVADARGCDAARLGDLDVLRTLFDRVIATLELRPVADTVWHRFPPIAESGAVGGGITGMCMLAESHLTVHTFPEHGTLCLNVFCCRVRDDWDVEAVLGSLLAGPGFAVRVSRIEREIAPSAVPGLRPADARRGVQSL